MLAKLKK